MKRLGFVALLSALVVPATLGCGRPPAIHYYLLETPEVSGQRPSSRSSGARIGVEPFVVDAPYDQDRIVYRIGGDSPEVGFYEYHRWAAPVSRMLARFVASSLEGTPGVATVEPLDVASDVDLLLQGRLRVLEEVDLEDGQRVRVELDLRLRDLAGVELWYDRLSAHVDLRAETVSDIVDALSQALTQALLQKGDIPLSLTIPPRPDP